MNEAKLPFKTSDIACFQTKRVGKSISTMPRHIGKLSGKFHGHCCQLNVASRHVVTHYTYI